MNKSNMKTTVIGLLTGLFTAVEPIVANGHFDIKTDWPKIAMGIGAALLGLAAKDASASDATPAPASVPVVPSPPLKIG